MKGLWRWTLALAALLVMLAGGGCARAEDALFGTVSGADQVNLRQQAAQDSALLGSYAEGAWLEIAGQSGNWYYVTTPDGIRGYMSKSYVQPAYDTYGNIGLVNNPPPTSFLNLRAAPSLSAKVLGIYYNDTPCVLLGEQSGWYHVRVDGVEGYFKADYIKQAYRAYSEQVATISTPGGTSLNLRSGPGKSYASLRQFYGGQYVMVLHKGNGWWRVSVDGYVGFMSAEFLRDGVMTPEGVTATEAVTGNAPYESAPQGYGGQSYVIVNNPKSTQVLNFREQPSADSRVIAQYSNGSQLTLLGAGEEWCYVEDANGVAGYMMTQFLRVYNFDAKPTLQVEHPQKSYVNLRAEPSMSGKVLDKVPHGASVVVLVPGETWVKVRYQEQTGYMVASYLK